MGTIMAEIQAGVFGVSNPGGIRDHPNRFLSPPSLLFNVCRVSFGQGNTYAGA